MTVHHSYRYVVERPVEGDAEQGGGVHRTDDGGEEKVEEVPLVGEADAVVDPRTVVVHLQAASIALGAVVAAGRLETLTGVAVLQVLLVFRPLRPPSSGHVARAVEDGGKEVEEGGDDEAAVEAQVEQIAPPPQGHRPLDEVVQRRQGDALDDEDRH